MIHTLPQVSTAFDEFFRIFFGNFPASPAPFPLPKFEPLDHRGQRPIGLADFQHDPKHKNGHRHPKKAKKNHEHNRQLTCLFHFVLLLFHATGSGWQ